MGLEDPTKTRHTSQTCTCNSGKEVFVSRSWHGMPLLYVALAGQEWLGQAQGLLLWDEDRSLQLRKKVKGQLKINVLLSRFCSCFTLPKQSTVQHCHCHWLLYPIVVFLDCRYNYDTIVPFLLSIRLKTYANSLIDPDICAPVPKRLELMNFHNLITRMVK